MNKIIVIIGPTGSGKTDLALYLSKKINGEIINADAFQVYKEIPIGTNAYVPKKNEPKIHLNNCLSIYKVWNIKEFQKQANLIIKKIIKNKHVPIIVGGSNLYVDALINNYDLSSEKRDDKFENLDNKTLFSKLKKLDKVTAEKIGINNKKRLIRALQILSLNKSLTKKNKILYKPLYIYCEVDRDLLYKKINDNVDMMFKKGWINEVKNIYEKDKNIDKLNALKAIGYLDIINFLKNGTEIDKEKIKQNSRHYAKRQITWIRHHFDGKVIFNKDKKDIVLVVKKFLEK